MEPKAGRLGIGARLALATVSVLVLASLVLYSELTRREHQSLVREKTTAAAMVADLFAASLSAPLDFADQDAIESEVRNLESNPDVSCIAVFGKSAEPLAKLARGCDATAPIGEADLAAPVVDAEHVAVAREVRGRSGPVGRTRVVFSLARENAAFEASRTRLFVWSTALALGTALVLLAIARRQIVRPLRRLTEAARRVGRGELGARVGLARDDEIGQLGASFDQMSADLRDREERLATATKSLRELLDHMRQGILAFERDGRVRGETSEQARAFFGRDVEGKSVSELLWGKDPTEVDAQAFEELRTIAFDLPPERWDELAELAPHEVVVGKRALELELRPVVRDGKIERVMLLATDVSEKKRLEEEAAFEKEEHARRIAAMRRLVAGGANLFVAFTETARDHVAASLATLGSQPRDLERAEIDLVFRRVHTMKGEARAFDLRELEGILGELEGRLRKLRDAAARVTLRASVAPPGLQAPGAGLQVGRERETPTRTSVAPGGSAAQVAAEHAALTEGLQRADDAILRAREDFVAVSPTGRAALDQMTVQRSDVEELAAIVRGRGDRVEAIAQRLTARRFGETTTTLVDQVPAWAAREGKQVELAIEGRDVRIPSTLARALGAALAHLVRNAVAHGIETPLERTREGKEPIGVVRVAAEEALGARGPIVVVEDDGRGFDDARIHARAKALGLDDDAPSSELVFATGLSTRDAADELGGLGVGLDAVRGELAAVGYVVRADSTPGKSTRFVLAPA
ncbi:MAG TPA: HAMP domain-containing protein [Labilithrix sp.]